MKKKKAFEQSLRSFSLLSSGITVPCTFVRFIFPHTSPSMNSIPIYTIPSHLVRSLAYVCVCFLFVCFCCLLFNTESCFSFIFGQSYIWFSFSFGIACSFPFQLHKCSPFKCRKCRERQRQGDREWGKCYENCLLHTITCFLNFEWNKF